MNFGYTKPNHEESLRCVMANMPSSNSSCAIKFTFGLIPFGKV